MSVDNSFLERNRGINDQNNTAQRKWISPSTGFEQYEQARNSGTQFDFTEAIAWSVNPGAVDKGATFRQINYQFSLDYNRTFGDHKVSGLALMQRTRRANGSDFPRFREDWVYRIKYEYKGKYLFESDGAYNGSEQFGPAYRFAFFPSLSAGWVVSQEAFMNKLTFVDLLKI